jgi:ADP-ribosylglycohydrolase
METANRARGALHGLAIGDALGMPAQMLSRAEIVRRWGPLLPGFEPAPPGHPIAAGMAASRGHWVAGADVASRIEWAADLVEGRPAAEAAGLIYTLVGTSLATQESVPAAFAVLAAVPDDPWAACRLAASLGGDCDTIAAMAGAIAGACPRRRLVPARGHRRHRRPGPRPGGAGRRAARPARPAREPGTMSQAR